MRRQYRDAKGVEGVGIGEAPGALGERRELHSLVQGGAPAAKAFS